MNKQKLLTSIKQSFMVKRYKAQEECEEFINSLRQNDEFNKMMDNYLTQLALKQPSEWSAQARAWSEPNGIITGDEYGNRMYKKFITREELITILFRLYGNK